MINLRTVLIYDPPFLKQKTHAEGHGFSQAFLHGNPTSLEVFVLLGLAALRPSLSAGLPLAWIYVL
jgi:hypothetical protein